MVEVGLSSSIRGDILQEAVNATLRRHLGAENTFKNCSGALRLPYLDFQKNSTNDTYMIDYVGGLKAGEYGREIVRTKYMATNIDRNFSTVTLYISATGGCFHKDTM